MGQQISSTSNTYLSNVPLSFNSLSSQNGSNLPGFKTIKTVNVGSTDELQLLKETFKFRLKNKQYLAHCYGFQVLNMDQSSSLNKFGCSSSSQSVKIIFHYQKITLKFSDLYQISIEQGLQILSKCLKGFSVLYDKFGYFTPQSRLIMKQGQDWRVWISENIFAVKNQIQQFSHRKKQIKEKFFQKVVHLFDALRDSQHPNFSYSAFIYGRVKENELMPFLQLSQILQKIGQTFKFDLPLKKQKSSLRGLTLSLSQTMKRNEFNTLMSFDQNTNEETVSKFRGNTFNRRKNQSKTIYENGSMFEEDKQNLKSKNYDICHLQRKRSLRNQRNNSYYKKLQESACRHLQQTVEFKRVSSQFIQGIYLNQNLVVRQNDYNYHIKNKSTVSTPSNCTGRTKNISPIKLLCSNFKQNVFGQSRFTKKQRSFTMDFSCQTNSGQFKEIVLPRRITQNSAQINSDSSQNDAKKNNAKEAFVQSVLQLQRGKNGQIKIISKSPSSRTPSIDQKTRKYGKQTMKYFQEYLMGNSKGSHKRSLTADHAEYNNQPKKMKFCWSQEFDSEFFSSRKQNALTSNMDIKDAVKQEKQDNQASDEEATSSQPMISIKRVKRVKVTNQKQLFESSKNRDNSNHSIWIPDISGGSKQVSIAKFALFNSQAGIKGILNSKLNTLKSIKQIQVDYPIDEDILNDLNKLFTKHRFAKSSHNTQ